MRRFWDRHRVGFCMNRDAEIQARNRARIEAWRERWVANGGSFGKSFMRAFSVIDHRPLEDRARYLGIKFDVTQARKSIKEARRVVLMAKYRRRDVRPATTGL